MSKHSSKAEANTKPTGRPPVHLPVVLGFVRQGGSKGASSQELCEALPNLSRSTIHNSAIRLAQKGVLKRRESRQLVVYYDAKFTSLEIDADFSKRCAERDEDQRATKQSANDRANVKARAGRAGRALQRLAADAARVAKRAEADQARREREAKQAEAIKERKRSAVLKSAARAEMHASNAHAAAIFGDGTHERNPRIKPIASAVEIPEHLIQRTAPKLMWHETLHGAGVISRTIGVYDRAASCAARAVAS